MKETQKDGGYYLGAATSFVMTEMGMLRARLVTAIIARTAIELIQVDKGCRWDIFLLTKILKTYLH